MSPFARIVFPVDYSEGCRAIVPYVAEMVRHWSAHLTIVHAYSNTDWLDEVERREQRMLDQFVAEAFPTRHVDAFLEEAEAFDAIEKVVRKQQADLVMMPNHSLGPMGRQYFGSITAKVLHRVRAAVWTASAHAREAACKSLLCAVDFSEETEALLRTAAAVASSYQARLSLVHVVEPSAPDRITAANERLAGWKRRLQLEAPHKILSGTIADAVRDEAVQERADLMVVGRGLAQGPLSRFVSQLYPIIRESPCPVLSI